VFSADGHAVLFHSSRTSTQQIFRIDLDGSGLRQLTGATGGAGGAGGAGANLQPSVSADGSVVAFVTTREGNHDIWLMAPDGTGQRPFTQTPRSKESYPRFLRDGTLAYLVERQQGNQTITQVYRADLATGQTTPLTGTDLHITAFAISPGGDLLALVVPVPGSERRSTPSHRVYVQPVGAGGPVAIPAAMGEQLVAPAFQP
jgi:Tol biopolymer transport system component